MKFKLCNTIDLWLFFTQVDPLKIKWVNICLKKLCEMKKSIIEKFNTQVLS